MKRLGNGTFKSIIDIQNIYNAHYDAQKSKSHYKQVKEINNNIDYYMNEIWKSLYNKTFTTSKYKIEDRIIGNKERRLYILPYYPDRIIQHALIRVVNERLEKSLIRDTFQSIKNRGTSDCRKRIEKAIKTKKEHYYLKLDIKKFYPSIDNSILKQEIRKYIKCENTLWLIDNIIDSVEGLPIGNYTSQTLGNIYLNDLDWFIKQNLNVKSYFRYCDDLLLLSNSKKELEYNKIYIENFLHSKKLLLKDYQLGKLNNKVYFVGFNYSKNNIYLSNIIKNNLKDRSKDNNESMIFSYFGFCKQSREIKFWKQTFHNQLRYI